MTGYADAAGVYLTAGWSSPLPLPPSAKQPVPVGFTGRNGVRPGPELIERWRVEHADGNLALRLGAAVIGIDLDLYKQPDARARLEKLLKAPLPATWCSTSRTDGSGIFLYRVPPLPTGKRWRHAPVPGCEIVQRHHRYAVCWPSTHPEGRPYRWLDHNGADADRVPDPDDITFLETYSPLLEDDPEYDSREPIPFDLTDGEPEAGVLSLLERGLQACNGDRGSRHDAVRDVIAGLVRLAEQGELGVAVALAELRGAFVHAVGPDRGGRRKAEHEYDELVDGGRTLIARTTPTPIARPAAPSAPVSPCSLGQCIDTYRRWLHLPDSDQVTAALGAVAANLLPGDPLWLLLVGSSGSGKTETIEPLDGLPYVYKAATLTEPALLSGSSKRDSEKGATGGILRQVGDFGILLAKDFGSVLSMNRDGRAQTLAALREIADGSWARPIGTAGGRILHWSGKCGLVGAVTPTIDRHYAVMGALGERFLLYRIAVAEPSAQALRRLRNRGREADMRAELTATAAAVLAGVGTTLPALTDTDAERLVALAVFVVWARTPVERDGYNQEVVAMPSREAPARLAGSLGQLLAGLEAIGADAATRWRIVDKCAWDCVPNLRSRILHALRRLGDSRSSDVVGDTGIPKNTADRTLEDLALLGLIHRDKAGTGDTAPWTHRLTAEAEEAWPSFPREVGGGRKSADPSPHQHVSLPLLPEEDMSGEGK